jgi:hypothetical protein
MNISAGFYTPQIVHMELRIYDAVQQVNIFFSNVMLMQKK